ncbi:unnamed protein product [Closterium sp. NIES-53]
MEMVSPVMIRCIILPQPSQATMSSSSAVTSLRLSLTNPHLPQPRCGSEGCQPCTNPGGSLTCHQPYPRDVTRCNLPVVDWRRVSGGVACALRSSDSGTGSKPTFAQLCHPQFQNRVSQSHGLQLACRSGADNNETENDSTADGEAGLAEAEGEKAWWAQGWDVPWGWRETGIGMSAWISSFIFVGIAVQLACLKLGWAPWRGTDLNDEALFLLINQSVRTASGIAIVWFVARPFQPLSTDLFHWGFEDPFSCRKGWLSWASVGVLSAGLVVFATATATTMLSGGIDAPREEADALVQVLPIIAASPFSTGALIFVAGVLAPILEETIFRAFLLTSLTKWMPVPLAVAGSACAFAAAHMTPNEFPKLAALGLVLGFSYVRTRNLLTPIIIHSVWNSGVIILLTLLRMEGYDIQELI